MFRTGRTMRRANSVADLFLTLGTGLRYAGYALSPLLLLPIAILIVPGVFAGIGARASDIVDRISGVALGAAVWSALLLLFAILVLIVLRYAYGLAFSWLSELVIYAFAAMFLLAAAGALRDQAHVRVDILRPIFGPRGRAIVEFAGTYLFLIPICILILDASISRSFVRSWAAFEGSRESDGLPILFLFKTLIPIFAALLLAQGVSEAVKAALSLMGRRPFEEDAGHGVGAA